MHPVLVFRLPFRAIACGRPGVWRQQKPTSQPPMFRFCREIVRQSKPPARLTPPEGAKEAQPSCSVVRDIESQSFEAEKKKSQDELVRFLPQPLSGATAGLPGSSPN